MGAPAARVSELARYWVSAGHEVTVLTGFPNHPTGVLVPEYRSRFRRLVSREVVDGVNVVRTWLLPLPNRKSYERMLNYSSFCVSAAVTGSFIGSPDVLIATSPQLLVGLSGWWVSRLKNIPFVFEVRDLWPESLVAVGVGDQHSILTRLLTRISGFLYNSCNHLVVVTPAFKTHIAKQWNVPGEKISVVPNGVETELFSPAASNGVRAELGIEGRFVVSYIGTIGMAHDLETVLDVAANCQQSLPEVLFLIVGEGAEKERIATVAGQRGLKNVRFVGQQPRQSIPAFVCASDVCLVTLRRSDVFKTVVPTKMLEFMSCARPVILSVEGQAKELVEEAGAGICVEPEHPASMLNAISRLYRDRDLCRGLGEKGRAYIAHNLSRRRTAGAYLSVLQALLNCTVATGKHQFE